MWQCNRKRTTIVFSYEQCDTFPFAFVALTAYNLGNRCDLSLPSLYPLELKRQSALKNSCDIKEINVPNKIKESDYRLLQNNDK